VAIFAGEPPTLPGLRCGGGAHAGTAALGVLRSDGPILAWHVPRDCTRVYSLVALLGITSYKEDACSRPLGILMITRLS